MRACKRCFWALMFLIPFVGLAQITVSGVVTEATTGTPLPGVNVIVKNTTNGVATDFDGNYQITANQGDTLVFSYVGFTDQEVVVSSSTINVALTESDSQLDEVVVIGYGTTTVKDATGAVTAITSEDFAKGNIATPENLLNGRAAGVTVNTSGAPGSGSAIRIRGGASLTASNDPLIVIDGLPITNQTAGGSRSILASINPADIDSFSILKNASATAIYGSRASNGVIIITTKKGRKNLNVEFSSSVAFDTFADEIDVFNGDEFRQIINQRQPALAPLLGDANTNWQDVIFSNATTFDNNLSVRGGLYEGKLPARLSIGFRNQPGTLETSKFNRYTFGMALNPTFLDDHLRVNLNANFTREENRFADQGQVGAALRYDPTQPVFDPSNPFGGFFQFLKDDGDKPANAPSNPLATLLQTKNVGGVSRLFGNLEFDYKLHFFPDVRAVVQLGYDKSTGSGSSRTDPDSFNGFLPNTGIGDPEQNNLSFFESFRENKQFYSYLVYNKDLENIDFEVTGGYDYQKFQQRDFGTGNLRAFTLGEQETTRPIDLVLTSFFGRAQVDLLDKYLFTFTYRRDGSSRFIDEFRWGDFPSAAFAWQVSDENFLKDSKTISNLKLRLSWGITGQQDLGTGLNNPFQNTFTSSGINTQYLFAGTPIITLTPDAFNRSLKWEETTEYNVGVDMGFFDQRLSASIDAFLKISDDLLFAGPVADGANFSNQIFQNLGQFSTKGLEFTLNAAVVQKEDFTWDISFNSTMLDREIDELVDGNDIDVGGRSGGTGGTVQVFREGETPNSFFVYQQLYDTNGAPIEGAFRDLNGDGIINTLDRYIRGNPDADITMGFRSDFTWKKWDFSFQMRASLGNEVYNNVNSANAYFNLLDGNGFPSNIPTAVTRTNFSSQDAFIINSDLYVEDGSFLRMDNITLGYTFDNVFRLNSSRLRVTAGVQNAFLITDYSGLDPEIFNGIDNTIYPRARTFLFGANFSL